MALSRRSFLKGIFSAVAVVAAAKAGLGNVTTESIAANIHAAGIEADWSVGCQTLWGMPFRIDPNCPPDTIYVVNFKEFFDENVPLRERVKYGAAITNLAA